MKQIITLYLVIMMVSFSEYLSQNFTHEFTETARTTKLNGYIRDIAIGPDGTLFVAHDQHGLRAYTYDGNSFTNIAHINDVGSSVFEIADDRTIFRANGEGVLIAYEYSQINDKEDFDPILGNKFQTVLDSIIQISDPKGVSACVITPDGGMWSGVSGISHDGIPITPNMHFWIASNTKTFSAVLIMLLVEEGILSLDDPISNWLPSYQNINGAINIRQLLNHTSGISDYLEDNPKYKNDILSDPGKFWSPEYTLNYVLPPRFLPGTNWKYSTTNYILLGMILREAFETDTLASVFRNKILNPLGLEDTYLGIEESHIGNLAHGWSDIESDMIRDDLTTISDTAMLSSLWTGGGMISTASDMAKWIRDLYHGEIVSMVSLSEMTDFVSSNWGPIVTGHGLGTTLLIIDGDSLYGHGGYYVGYNSEIIYDPQRDISIAVLMNRDSFDKWPQWSDLIVRELYREIVKDELTDVQNKSQIQSLDYLLYQSYPNPFNPSTTIKYSIPKLSNTTLKVFDVLGSEIVTLVNTEQSQGHYEVKFDGSKLSSGIYFYQLKAGDFVETKKMILIK